MFNQLRKKAFWGIGGILLLQLALVLGAKVVAEIVHEVFGHGLFVLLFGGEITEVHISPLWPYELSYIRWKGGFEPWQLPWLQGGGILICLVVTLCLQAVLLLRPSGDWRLSSPPFWLSFWAFLNPAGYLILGGISPFGDVAALIGMGVLDRMQSLAIGLLVFVLSHVSLTKIWLDILILAGIESWRSLRISLCMLWLIVPLTTAAFAIGRGQPSVHLLLSVIPVILAAITPSIPWKRREKVGQDRNPA